MQKGEDYQTVEDALNNFKNIAYNLNDYDRIPEKTPKLECNNIKPTLYLFYDDNVYIK